MMFKDIESLSGKSKISFKQATVTMSSGPDCTLPNLFLAVLVAWG